MDLETLCGRACYSRYVLVLLLVAYLLNQLHRFLLAIVAKPIAQDLHYGDMQCMPNASVVNPAEWIKQCNATTPESCRRETLNSTLPCEWNYNGQGFEYQLLAGPVFVVVYTFAGILVGFAADYYNRKNLLSICVVFWSVMTALSGLAQQYWQLAITRFGLGIGQAGCTPFATSLIADYFAAGSRGLALGIYNLGIYIGYSMSYAVGNLISQSLGWRWAFLLCGIPGVVAGLMFFLTIIEPVRQQDDGERTNVKDMLQGLPWYSRLGRVLKPFIKPSVLCLCLGGSVRNSAGYVWAYNTQPYFIAIGQTEQQIASWMSWIPLVGGSLGVVLGGFISDRFVKKMGPQARILVLIGSQLCAAPFGAAALYFRPPVAYIMLIPANIIGEMWVGVTLAVVVEVIPATLRTSAVAVYLFIISNIAGLAPLLVPVFKSLFQQNTSLDTAGALRAALYIMYPGLYVLSVPIFLLTLFFLKRDVSAVKYSGYETLPDSSDAEETEPQP